MTSSTETGPSTAEQKALLDVERAARAYAAHTHGNIGESSSYRRREEARDRLLDALARLDRIRDFG